jgi:hypothetical protein
VELFPVSRWSYLLDAVQALCVLLPAAGLPAWLARNRVAALSRWWALVLPGSLVVCVGGIALLPGAADGFTYLALFAVPPLAVAACAWAAHGARPWLGGLGLALVAGAFLGDGLFGDATATAITALSCVTLGRLLVAVAPHLLVKVALVVMALIDAYLVFGGGITKSAGLLNAAAPAYELPKLQTAFLDRASLGYGDLFVAAVFGALLAAERRRQGLAAAVCLLSFVAFDVLFNWFDSLPATVPVAVVLVGWELAGRRRVASAHALAASPGRP